MKNEKFATAMNTIYNITMKGKVRRMTRGLLCAALISSQFSVLISCSDYLDVVPDNTQEISALFNRKETAFNALATAGKLVLGIRCANLSDTHDVVEKLEGAGNKNLIIDVTGASIREAFANAMLVRRAALKGGDRTFGYPSIVNTARLARGDSHMQAALASMFTLRYGSIVVLDSMSYAEALPLYGLRQNIFTDPQKPMKVEPGVYPLNGADENSICCVTVDFALTYFVVSGELERSGVPINMFITDAGGYSVLTSWAAGKFSAGSIEKFF